jgi:hypothetical protein
MLIVILLSALVLSLGFNLFFYTINEEIIIALSLFFFFIILFNVARKILKIIFYKEIYYIYFIFYYLININRCLISKVKDLYEFLCKNIEYSIFSEFLIICIKLYKNGFFYEKLKYNYIINF